MPDISIKVVENFGSFCLCIHRQKQSTDQRETVLIRISDITSITYDKMVSSGEIILTIFLRDQGKWTFAADEAQAIACTLGIDARE